MTRRKTDGERITDLLASFRGFEPLSLSQLSARIDRAIRKRQREAWEEGWSSGWDDAEATRLGRSASNYNPYEGRKKK